MLKVLLLSLAACSPVSTAGDAAPANDAKIVTPAGTPLAVNCQPYTRTVTAADGSKVVTTQRWAILDVSQDEEAVVTYCFAPSYLVYRDAPCLAGYACSGTNYPGSAADARCGVSRNAGIFIGGKLTVDCGSTTQRFDAAGVMTSSTGTDYASITATKLP